MSDRIVPGTREQGADQDRAARGQGSVRARRRAARLAAVQALYQVAVNGTGTEAVIGEFMALRIGKEIDGELYVPADPNLFAAIVRGVAQHDATLDEMIAGTLDARSRLARLELLIRCILRAGAFELLAHHEIDAPIIINEYVDVAHAFFSGREPGMINGVLDHMARVVRGERAERMAEKPRG